MDQPLPFDAAKALENAKDIVCPLCNANTFENIVMIKKISALMSPTGQESIIPLPAYRCTECKRVLEQEDIEGTKLDAPKLKLI